MIKFLKTQKITLLLFAIITFTYFLLRLPNLTLQPIFADEAIYIRWAQIMKAEPTLRFMSLADGKTPLFMWAMTPFFKIFSDPLFAGRFLSVLSGYLTLSGVFFLGWRFFNLRTALWAAFLVAITPFSIFFDRMALVDSLLAASSIWALNFALLLIRFPRLDLAMFLGYILGAGLLIKTPGFFNVLTIPVSLITFKWLTQGRDKRLLKIFGLWGVSLAITLVIYNLLRLGPGFDSLSSRNQDYIFSPLDLVGRPLDPFIPHLHDLTDWFLKFLNIPIILLILAGIIVGIVKKNRFALAILFWSLLPLIAELALLKTFTARYILFTIPPLYCLAGLALNYLTSLAKFKNVIAIPVIVLVLAVSTVSFNLNLLTDPLKLDLPRNERAGYFEAWTAGYGLKDIAQFLIHEAQKGTIVVGTEGSFGTLPDGLQIYFEKYIHQAPQDKQIIVVGGRAEVSEAVREAAGKNPTFFIANRSRFLGEGNLTLLKEYPKAEKSKGSQDAILLFKVLPGR